MSVAEDIVDGVICQECFSELKEKWEFPVSCTDCYNPDDADDMHLDFKGDERLHD